MDDKKFATMVCSGVLLKEVAVAFDCTVSNVVYHMDRLGLERRNRRKVRLKSGDRVGEWELQTRRVVNGRGMWLCRCSCGRESEVEAGALGSDKSTRCKTCCDEWAKMVVVPDRYWAMLMASAKKRSKTWGVTQEYASRLLVEQGYRCALTGEPIEFAADSRTQRSGQSSTASLDRKDSTLGYVVGNVWWVHKIVNWMKGPLPNDRFIEYCRKVADHSRRPVGVEGRPDTGGPGESVCIAGDGTPGVTACDLELLAN